MVKEASPKVLATAVVAVLLSLSFPERTKAIWLTLPATGSKCVSEEIRNSILVLADYIVIPGDPAKPTPTISAKVTSPYGHIIHNRENATHGQFAFTSSETGNYIACFTVDGHTAGAGEVNINLIWKMGVAAKDWESVARKRKLEGVELELTKLEEVVEAIHDNLLYLRTREAEMRVMSESINVRVSWLGISAMGICIMASTMQVFRLKKYFQRRKLI